MEETAQTQSEFFAGEPKDGKWTGVFIMPEKSSKTDRLGQLHVLISLSAPKEFDSKLAGDLLLENIQDVYYEDWGEKNVPLRLEKAIMTTARKLQHLLEREEVAGQEGIDLNVLTFVIKDDFIYMALLGDGSVSLYRNGKLIELTEGLKDLSGRNLIKSGSGKFESDDRFVLLSEEALFYFDENKLKRLAEEFTLDELDANREEALFGVVLIGIDVEASSGEKEEKSVLPLSKKKEEVSEHTGATDISKDAKTNGEGKRVFDDKQNQKAEAFAQEPEPDEKNSDPKESAKKEKNYFPEGKGDHSIKQKKEEDSKLQQIKEKVSDKLTDKKTYQVIWEKIRQKSIRLYGLFKVHVWQGLFGFTGKGIYLKGSGPKKNIRGILILIIVVGALLFFSIRGVKRHIETSDKKGEIEVELQAINEKFISAKGLGEAGNIEEAAVIMDEALNKLSELKQYEVMLDEIEKKENEGISIMDEVKRVVKITDANLFTDIAGFVEGANPDDFDMLNGTLYIIDSQNSSIYEIDSSGGEVSVFVQQDPNLVSPQSLVFDGNGDMLIYDSSVGITKLNIQEKAIEKPAGLSTTSVGEVVEIENYVDPQFNNNYLYLLRSADKDVRKISTVASGYTWPDVKVPTSEQLAGAKDIEIDGKIYILSNPHGVSRYYIDSFDSYTLLGLDKPIDQATSLELDPLLVYFGDSVNKRVVVTTKGAAATPQQGQYVAQIVYRGEGNYLTDIEEIIVDHDKRIMYILDGTKIFKVDLDKVDEYVKEYQ